jgi:hypothetical protein
LNRSRRVLPGFRELVLGDEGSECCVTMPDLLFVPIQSKWDSALHFSEPVCHFLLVVHSQEVRAD